MINFLTRRDGRNMIQIGGSKGALNTRDLKRLLFYILFKYQRVGITVQGNIRLPGFQRRHQPLCKIQANLETQNQDNHKCKRGCHQKPVPFRGNCMMDAQRFFYSSHFPFDRAPPGRDDF